MRHKWTNKRRTYGSWFATCERCGLERDQRFCRDTHWTEWRRPNGEWFASDKTPPCEHSNDETDNVDFGRGICNAIIKPSR